MLAAFSIPKLLFFLIHDILIPEKHAT